MQFIPVDVMGGASHKRIQGQEAYAVALCFELHDGMHISQRNAMLEYIDGSFGGPIVVGNLPKDRARIAMTNLRVEKWPSERSGRVLPSWEARPWAESGSRPVRRLGQPSEKEGDDTMAYHEAFLAGEAFSIANITGFAELACADFNKVDIPECLTHLSAWRERIAARSSVSG